MAEWFVTNREPLTFVAGLMPPVISLLAVLVSYRALVIGPRIQLEIAGEQFALQERSIAVASAQISANLLGAAEQKWIDEFRNTLAELSTLVLGISGYGSDHPLPLGERNVADLVRLTSKIQLMVPKVGIGAEFLCSMEAFNKAEDQQAIMDTAGEVTRLALMLIKERQERVEKMARCVPAS